MPLDRHHERIRTRGINPVVYWITRAILQPFLLLYFRTSRIGREHIPREGAALLAANHKSFVDPFLIGMCLRRPIYFVAKRELFENRLIGWFLNCLGAFPIRRGESDEEAVATASSSDSPRRIGNAPRQLRNQPTIRLWKSSRFATK